MPEAYGTLPRLEHTFDPGDGTGRDDEALRGPGGGGAGRRDARRVHVARAAVRGSRRDRTVADRGPVVGRGPRPRVLAGRGSWGSGHRPLPRPSRGPMAPGAAVGLIRDPPRAPPPPTSSHPSGSAGL